MARFKDRIQAICPPSLVVPFGKPDSEGFTYASKRVTTDFFTRVYPLVLCDGNSNKPRSSFEESQIPIRNHEWVGHVQLTIIPEGDAAGLWVTIDTRYVAPRDFEELLELLKISAAKFGGKPSIDLHCVELENKIEKTRFLERILFASLNI